MKRRLLLLRSAGVAGLPWWAAPASADLPALIKRAKPSLLLVGTYAETDSPRFAFRGTGFVVDDGRHAITNAHVLPPTSDEERQRKLVIQVPQGDGRWGMRPAAVLSLDNAHDLALLRFDGPEVPALQLSQSASAQEGQAIALMGFPVGGALGFSPVTHRGIIAAITSIALPPPSAQTLNARAIRQLRDGAFDILQLDATAYPGNSGGPVFNLDTGEVLGIVNMVFIKGSKETALTQPTGISYAIPAHYAARLLAKR
ncbi:S1C family serine protease [Paucibacter sp. M5-1]|uniref:S1C family serine protease n=1 Tax=Paucibacter sp. M5-1 TaxID=3015998 RepID=UPI0010F63565|nr:serine protease [Paucibacter sp. M5-1]MCZ7884895.1 serine protease [Paucibacter sp. M5-1]